MDIDHRGGFLQRDFSWLLTHDFRWIKAWWCFGAKQRGRIGTDPRQGCKRWGLALHACIWFAGSGDTSLSQASDQGPYINCCQIADALNERQGLEATSE